MVKLPVQSMIPAVWTVIVAGHAPTSQLHPLAELELELLKQTFTVIVATPAFASQPPSGPHRRS